MSRSVKSSKHQVIAADEKVMTIVLKGKQSDHLDTMRYQRFQERVTTGKKAIHPYMLPPKCAATKCHNSESSSRSNSRRGILLRLEIGVGSFVEEDSNQ